MRINNQPTIVQKYGGSSLASLEKISKVASQVAARYRAGNNMVVVVSAMGHTTNDLLAMAKNISEAPGKRELDMLLTAGERISMSLLGIALQKEGVPAISLTGSQCGIMTTNSHSNARIVEVRPFRIEDALEEGQIVVVAGYQGVSYQREVTTLGRGGSDTTAVALAAALNADACEIYSDVDGVYTGDPRIVDAKHLEEISYAEMQELAAAGAKVLNAQAVEFAKKAGIAIYCRATDDTGRQTIVRQGGIPRTSGDVTGVTSTKALLRLDVIGQPQAMGLLEILDNYEVPSRQLVATGYGSQQKMSLLIPTADAPTLPEVLTQLREIIPDIKISENVGAVSMVGENIMEKRDNLRRAMSVLAQAGITWDGIVTTNYRITFMVEAEQLTIAVKLLHSEFLC